MKLFNNLPIYQVDIEDSTDLGLTKISLVDSPAVDSDFFFFNKTEKIYQFEDDEKHIVTGVSLRADYPIYRNDDGFEYYCVFNKETIKDLVERYFQNKSINNTSINHTTDIDGVTMIESYFIDKKNGICPLLFDKITDGSWITTFKVNNREVWKSIKDKTFKGFSVECLLDLKEEEEDDIKDLEDFINKILKK